MCEAHDVFKPTFPLDNMSNLELEHAATAPKRFLNLIKHLEPGSAPLPFSSREIFLRQNPLLQGQGAHDLRRIYLLPGGRFLLVSTKDLSLVLYDLGYSMRYAPDPYPIATSEKWGSVMGIRRFGDFLFVGTVGRFTRDDDPNGTQLLLLRINEVNLSDPSTAAFQPVAQLNLNNRQPYSVQFMVGSIGVAVLSYGAEIVVWNWMEKTGCKWRSELYLPTEKTTVYAFNKGLLTSDRIGNIYIWDIPDPSSLPFLPSVDQFPIVHNEPKVRIPYPGVFNNPSQPTPSGTFLSMFSVKRLGHRKDLFLPEAILVPGGTSAHLYGDSDIQYGSTLSNVYTCDDSLVFCAATSERALMVSVLPVPAKAELGEILVSSKYLTPEESVHNSFHPGKLGFCPFSGRVVFVKADGSICLRDFLLPPSES
ncbi:hypothetical protein NMY22_g6797 [Coprinellus aureogranulatus]|nr:hypothetical protein NMY22_g6797 [Coprinellus aureogranulatus]